jgi:hypothetical protein
MREQASGGVVPNTGGPERLGADMLPTSAKSGRSSADVRNTSADNDPVSAGNQAIAASTSANTTPTKPSGAQRGGAHPDKRAVEQARSGTDRPMSRRSRRANIEAEEKVRERSEDDFPRAQNDQVQEPEMQAESKRPDQTWAGALKPEALRAPYNSNAQSRRERHRLRSLESYSVLSQIWLGSRAAIKGHVRVTPSQGREGGGDVGSAAPECISAETFYLGEWCELMADVQPASTGRLEAGENTGL